MAKPPSDAPVLFDVYSDSSTIKQGKDGIYKLVMEGVGRVHWEEDVQVDETEIQEIPDTEEGYYSVKKYANNYDNYYGENAEVSAYQTFTLADGSKEKCKFTITDVKYNEESNKLVYDITPKNKKQADKITGFESETQTESAVYSTERTRWRPDWMPNGSRRNLMGADLGSADLSNADLMGADLGSADLSNADLMGADLSNANLSNADLSNANLWGTNTNLSNADLSNAFLSNAALSNANLMGADLSNANLWLTNLWGTNLSNANLMGADLWRADLSSADLRGALHLNRTLDADQAFWFETTCPDGSMDIGGQPCSEIF